MKKWLVVGVMLVILGLFGSWHLFSAADGAAEPVAGAQDAGAESTSTSPTAPARPADRSVESGKVEAAVRSREADIADRANAAYRRDEGADHDDGTEHPAATSAQEDEALRELQERMRAVDALPAERQFLLNDYVRVDATRNMVGSGDFVDVMDELAREAYGDFDAQALSDVYGGYVSGILARRGGFALDRLVCGMRLCMGRAIALSGEADWRPLNLFPHDGPPMYASVGGTYTGPDGTVFYQFLFTTDPQSPGFVVPSP